VGVRRVAERPCEKVVEAVLGAGKVELLRIIPGLLHHHNSFELINAFGGGRERHKRRCRGEKVVIVKLPL